MKTVLQRFEEKYSPISESGCWLWLGACNKKGYGNFWTGTRSIVASRMSYILYKKKELNNLLVCHTCDIPSCVNPDHLFLGTHKDNMLDSKLKHRTAILDRHPMAKLTTKDIKSIRSIKYQKYSDYQLSCIFLVSRAHINLIRRNKIWINI